MSDLSNARRRLRTPATGEPSQQVDQKKQPIAQSLLPWLRTIYRHLLHTTQHIVTRHILPFVQNAHRGLRRLFPLVLKIVRQRRLPQLSRRQWFILIISLVVVSFVILRPPSKSPSTATSTDEKTSSTTPSTTGPVKENPPFKALLPAGKNIQELGGWNRISPPEKDAVYAYVDRIGNIQINVSQQQLPRQLEENEKVKQLAESFDARGVIKADDTTVYIGESGQGPQSVIFTKNKLLILIKSSSRIADPLWQNYIKSLQ